MSSMVNWAARGLKPGQAGPGNGNVHGLDASVTCIQSEVPAFELSQHESQQKQAGISMVHVAT